MIRQIEEKIVLTIKKLAEAGGKTNCSESSRKKKAKHK